RNTMFTAPSGPITATSAVGHAKLKSARMCFELMTSYAPPYALRVITASFGTVASQYAYSSLAPWRMIPPHSCSVPGRKPGTSTNVTSGMLNASHVRTKRAPFTDESMSSTPATEARSFPRRVEVEHAAERFRLFADDADDVPAEPREAAHEVLGPALV